ncbi:porphobilinogen deaminase, dipyromethane cofactor binding domain-containing protein [Mycena crocata]|nr:porphobilinogen deaminase, dipyromethane cofactor binding domain-containing protein [Mycena crocata]
MADSTSRTFTLASRPSQLAQIQTNSVLATLESFFPPTAQSSPLFETAFISSAGDRNRSQALYLLGGKSLWTKDLEVALKERQVDMLVHCLKDVPTTLPEGCVIGAILERENPVDSLIVKAGATWKSLDELPAGSVVGTSSVRRIAQIRRSFPHLKFQDVRGNLDTRVAKLDAPDGPYAAIILAKAGMVRVGMGDRLTADLPPPMFYYAVSQGALAIEIRSDDAEAMEFCKRLNHRKTQWACLAERACLRVLEGGCSVPVGMSTKLDLDVGGGGGELSITGCVTSLDGRIHVEHSLKENIEGVQDAERVGARLADTLLETGAREILDDINREKEQRVAEAEVADEESSLQG